jgi:hypothetical protein
MLAPGLGWRHPFASVFSKLPFLDVLVCARNLQQQPIQFIKRKSSYNLTFTSNTLKELTGEKEKTANLRTSC